MRNRLLTAVFVLGLLFSVEGCGGKSQNARFYALSSLKEAPTAEERLTQAPDLVLGLGPITIADYLDRPEVVARDSQNQLTMNELEQWAGYFDKNVNQALADNLGFLLGTDSIHLYPWSRSLSIDYQITVDLIRFDGKLGDRVWLTARWSILDGQTEKLLEAKRSSIQEVVEDLGYEALVSAHSRALAVLSREMAEGIQSVRQSKE